MSYVGMQEIIFLKLQITIMFCIFNFIYHTFAYMAAFWSGMFAQKET